MGRANEQFSVDDQPEVFFSTTDTSAVVHYAVGTGRARRLARGVYTRNLRDDEAAICRRNWHVIAAGLLPGAVVVGRTAMDHRPAEDGSVFLEAPTTRDRRLPGLRLRPRHGVGPVDGDFQWMGQDLFMSSQPRAYLENLRPSRTRRGALSRYLTREELEERLERFGRFDATAFNRLRDEARALAPKLGATTEFEELDRILGALQGTREANLRTRRALAVAEGQAFDPDCIERVEGLAGALLAAGLPATADPPQANVSVFAFYEAYFSNYIEGTEFTVEEAERIVFEGEIPRQRPEDAHDILGTYGLVADESQRRRVPETADQLLAILRAQHGKMLRERPEVAPGEWKERPNQVGGRPFVPPRLVEGTLREAWRIYESVPRGLSRAALAMFLITEVHPFADGNGRMARVLMNSELTRAGEARIIVATRDRGDYVAALRGLSSTGNVDAYIATLTELQRRTVRVDFSSLSLARAQLSAEEAFTDADASSPGFAGGLLQAT